MTSKLLEYPRIKDSVIYGIQCLTSNKWYIGQTENFKKRFTEHTKTLQRNEHVNDHLQRAYNLYGADAFEVSILKKCDKSNLNTWEKYFMDYYNSHWPQYGYNIMYFDSDGKPTYTSYFAEKVVKGSRHNNKISLNDAKVIRDMYVVGYTPALIREKYKLNENHISDILSNFVWYDPLYSRPTKVPSVNPEEEIQVKKLILQGCSINKIIAQTRINWCRLNRYFDDNNLSRRPKHSSLILNTETGIYYNCISEAAESSNMPYSRLSDWLVKHPNRNRTPFILLENNFNKSRLTDVTILDTNTGIFYASFKEAAAIYSVSPRTICKWLTTHKHHNKTNLTLCGN
jgi:group I intron endonuclease